MMRAFIYSQMLDLHTVHGSVDATINRVTRATCLGLRICIGRKIITLVKSTHAVRNHSSSPTNAFSSLVVPPPPESSIEISRHDTCKDRTISLKRVNMRSPGKKPEHIFKYDCLLVGGTAYCYFQYLLEFYLEHVLVIGAGGNLESSIPSVAKSPRPSDVHSLLCGQLDGAGDLTPCGRVSGHVHHPVGVEPVQEQWLSIQHEMDPAGAHESSAMGDLRGGVVGGPSDSVAIRPLEDHQKKCQQPQLVNEPHPFFSQLVNWPPLPFFFSFLRDQCLYMKDKEQLRKMERKWREDRLRKFQDSSASMEVLGAFCCRVCCWVVYMKARFHSRVNLRWIRGPRHCNIFLGYFLLNEILFKL